VITILNSPATTSHLLLHFVGVQVFEEVAFLPLVVAHVESVPCYVLLLSVEVFYHWQSVIIWALLHGVCITRLLHTSTETTLVLDLSWGMGRRLLVHSIGVRFHYLLARA